MAMTPADVTELAAKEHEAPRLPEQQQDWIPEWLDVLRRRITPRVLVLTGGVDGCLLWRVWWACAHASSHGFVADYVRYEDLNQLYPLIRTGRYNMVVTPRFVWRTHEAAEQWLAAIRRDGLAWVYECDDDLWSPEIVQRQLRLYPAGHPSADPVQFEWERQERIGLVKFADGVTVTTEPLRQIVHQHTPAPVHVVPNSIDMAWFRKVMEGAERLLPPLTIGWMGGQREDSDLAAVGEAWSNLARRYPELRFVIQGYPAPALTAGVPADRLHVLPWQPIERYPQSLVNIDIGCCSVAPDPWNTRKSPIKWFEMTVGGAPCVVSPTLYGDVVTDGWDGFIAETPAEWEHRLALLVDDAELRRTMHRRAMQHVDERHSMRRNWWRWIAAWSSVLEQANA